VSLLLPSGALCNKKESPGIFTESRGSTEIYRAGQYKIGVMIKIRSLIFISLILILNGCNSGSVNKGDAADIQTGGAVADISFAEYEHDFGKVTEGEKIAYVFSFVNKGPGDLVINSASTTCGCTVTKYNRNPIPAGGGGSLEVVFDTSARNGLQSKTVSVKSNSKTEIVILKITAEVISKQ